MTEYVPLQSPPRNGFVHNPEEYKQLTRIRSGVETILSILRRFCHADRMPVRGWILSRFFFGCKIAAFNVCKLVTFRKGQGLYAKNRLLTVCEWSEIAHQTCLDALFPINRVHWKNLNCMKYAILWIDMANRVPLSSLHLQKMDFSVPSIIHRGGLKPTHWEKGTCV